MKAPKIADWIDETAYQHFKYAYHAPEVHTDEYMRAVARANFLKGWALFLGQKNYSYYDRADNETTYNDCE